MLSPWTREQFVVTAADGHRDVALEVLDGGVELARLHPADQRHQLGTARVHRPRQAVTACLAGVLHQAAVLDQLVEVLHGRLHGAEAHGLLHVTHRRRATLQQALPDEAVDLLACLARWRECHGARKIPDACPARKRGAHIGRGEADPP
jgi:hypothetical protein